MCNALQMGQREVYVYWLWVVLCVTHCRWDRERYTLALGRVVCNALQMGQREVYVYWLWVVLCVTHCRWDRERCSYTGFRSCCV